MGAQGATPSGPAGDDRTNQEHDYEDLEELSAGDAARVALRHIADLSGKEPSGVISLEPTDDGWAVGVEVIEDARIPSSADILGIYLVQLDLVGSLLAYRRVRRYARGRGDIPGEVT